MAPLGILARDVEGLNEESIHGARDKGLGFSKAQPQLWLTPPERPGPPCTRGLQRELFWNPVSSLHHWSCESTWPSSFSLLFFSLLPLPSLLLSLQGPLIAFLFPQHHPKTPLHLLEAHLSSFVGMIHICSVHSLSQFQRPSHQLFS